jgi:hypothetical protein
MLLNPRNSMEAYCQKKLKLNIDNTRARYFFCRDGICSGVGIFDTQKCFCGTDMCISGHVFFNNDLVSADNGFVKETATFIIHDDLSVMPNDLVRSLDFLQRNGINDIADIERKTILISKNEVGRFSMNFLDFYIITMNILCFV